MTKKIVPYGLCTGGNPKTIRTPWWETQGTYSSFACNCPIPEGATVRDMVTYDNTGYNKWKIDLRRPPIADLRRENSSHLRKYA